jgi:DNA-binding LacI/PurR family transcriptional regulator
MAISRVAARHGLQLTVHVADGDHDAESFLSRSMLHTQGGILVLWDSPAMQESFLRRLAAEGIPIIDLLPDSPPGISAVTPDREDAFYRGTRHLIQQGHRRIALVCDPIARQKTTLRKLAGYRRALTEAGLPYDENIIEKVGEFGFEGGYEGFRRLNRRCGDVTGAFCINDAMALGVIAAARDAGRSCPEDLSVIGFGDSAMGSYFRPRLTTFALSSDRVAEEALTLVVQQRQEPGQAPRTILIPEEMIVRESTARAPASRRSAVLAQGPGGLQEACRKLLTG